MPQLNDPHNLARFIEAQDDIYATVLSEIRAGRKQSHWMWFIFPQIAGLGFSAMSVRYAIQNLAEAKAYLEHPILGPRLQETMEAALNVHGGTANEIFGSPDDVKLRSSATLFAHVSAKGSVFEQVLKKYFGGKPDDATMKMIR